ncbi:MAG: hypothetical protein C0467_02865 [Planctomycetaceae bacterium]|nr:hypothetical protein [Planctomycetaceae bacterium]
MTDREPTVPAEPLPQLGSARTTIAGGPPTNTNAHPESALRGDAQPMSLTLAPRPPVRAPATDELPADPVRSFLARLTACSGELPAYPIAHAHPTADLTLAESEAATRAAACPDIYIINAPDFAVRERLVAAIAKLATAESGRCLVLSPNPNAADRLAERLAKLDESCVARALADDENPVRPSPLVSKLTSAALLARRVERLKLDAATAVTAADVRLTQIEKLIAQRGNLSRLDAEIAELAVQAATLEPVVRAETDTPFVAKLVALQTAHQQHSARLTAEIDALTQGLKDKEAALVAVRGQFVESTAEATKKPGFFARLIGTAKPGPTPAELEKQIKSLEADIAAVLASTTALKSKSEELATACAAEREQVIVAEVAARRADHASREAILAAERDRIQTEADASATVLGVSTATDLASIQYAATLALVETKERAAETARTANEIAKQFLATIPVVIGTPGSLHVDPVMGDGSNQRGPAFNLLILDQAEELAEHDFVHLAKLATRWVLIGNTDPAQDPKPHLNGSASRHTPGRNGRPVETPFTTRIARYLDRETWAAEGDRLVCRLLHATPDQRRNFSREPLIDRPEIELRFLTDSTGETALAEVAFPSAAAIADAKSFLFNQLGEVLLRPFGAVHWEQTETHVTACWPDVERSTAESTWIDLEPGVRERVSGTGATAFTAAVYFELASGWDADRAAAWLAERVPTESVGRFAVVPRTTRV